MKKRISVLPAVLFICLAPLPVPAQTGADAAGSGAALKLNSQAVALYKEGKYEEAIKSQKQALAMWEKELGAESKFIATGSTNLAEMYMALKRYYEAAEAYQRALKIEEKSLGPEHPNLVILLIKLAWSRHTLAQPGEAEALFKRAIAIREKQGAEQADVVGPLLNIAVFYQKVGRPAASIPIYHRVISAQEKQFGPEGEPLVDTLEMCACALQQDKKPTEASEMEKRARLIEQKAKPDFLPVSGGVLQGKAIHKQQPPYPTAARNARLSGQVFVKITIDETGKVTDAKIRCGADLLAGASLEAARKWRFAPTTIDGKPVKVIGLLTFNFTLQ